MKIALFCNAGMSSSLLVKRMKEEVAKEGKNHEIKADGLAKVQELGPWADIILVGPQVRHAIRMINDRVPGKPVQAIDMRKYGLIDAKGVIEDAEKFARENGITD